MPTGSEYIHGLDAEAYRNKISRPHFSDQELEQKIYEKRSKVNAAGWAIGAGVASIFFTLGVSALTLPLPLVASQIDQEKLALLEWEWSRRGYPTLATRVFQDGVIPCTIAGTVGAIGMGVGHGFLAAGSSCVNHAATAAGGHLAANTMQAHSVAPGTGNQFWSGAENGVQQTFGLMGHPTNGYITHASPYDSPAYVVGQAGGMDAVHQFIDYTTHKVGDWVQDQLVGRRTRFY